MLANIGGVIKTMRDIYFLNEAFFKIFRNAYDKEPDRKYLFHNINYSEQRIKSMIWYLFFSLSDSGVNKVYLYVNNPRFFQLDEKNKAKLDVFIKTSKKYINIYSKEYNIDVIFEE